MELEEKWNDHWRHYYGQDGEAKNHLLYPLIMYRTSATLKAWWDTWRFLWKPRMFEPNFMAVHPDDSVWLLRPLTVPQSTLSSWTRRLSMNEWMTRKLADNLSKCFFCNGCEWKIVFLGQSVLKDQTLNTSSSDRKRSVNTFRFIRPPDSQE